MSLLRRESRRLQTAVEQFPVSTEVRLRLVNPMLSRVFDSMDICQSVLGSFFVRAAAGQYDLEHPQQLVQLLIAITRNKLARQARHQYRQRRDLRRLANVAVDELDVAGRDQSPSQLASGKELLEAFRARLNHEERQLADLRAADYEAGDRRTIGRYTPGTAEAACPGDRSRFTAAGFGRLTNDRLNCEWIHSQTSLSTDPVSVGRRLMS